MTCSVSSQVSLLLLSALGGPLGHHSMLSLMVWHLAHSLPFTPVLPPPSVSHGVSLPSPLNSCSLLTASLPVPGLTLSLLLCFPLGSFPSLPTPLRGLFLCSYISADFPDPSNSADNTPYHFPGNNQALSLNCFNFLILSLYSPNSCTSMVILSSFYPISAQ